MLAGKNAPIIRILNESFSFCLKLVGFRALDSYMKSESDIELNYISNQEHIHYTIIKAIYLEMEDSSLFSATRCQLAYNMIIHDW
jgi:hypothetical protein